MYAKNKNNVTFFVDSYNENTDKVTYGRVSESVNYNKEKKASYPYLMVMDFDLQEDNK